MGAEKQQAAPLLAPRRTIWGVFLIRTCATATHRTTSQQCQKTTPVVQLFQLVVLEARAIACPLLALDAERAASTRGSEATSKLENDGMG